MHTLWLQTYGSFKPTYLPTYSAKNSELEEKKTNSRHEKKCTSWYVIQTQNRENVYKYTYIFNIFIIILLLWLSERVCGTQESLCFVWCAACFIRQMFSVGWLCIAMINVFEFVIDVHGSATTFWLFMTLQGFVACSAGKRALLYIASQPAS